MTRREHYAKMRMAKDAKREALGAVATLICGEVKFSGALFGEHTVRLSCREDAPDALCVQVDGRVTCCKTLRGIKALLMRRIGKTVFQN